VLGQLHAVEGIQALARGNAEPLLQRWLDQAQRSQRRYGS